MNSIANKSLLASAILASTTISSAESSEETLFEESEYESSDNDESAHSVTCYVYDGNKKGFKMLMQLFPQVALIQKIEYEKALPSPLMKMLLETVRMKNKASYLGPAKQKFILQSWLRTCNMLNKWPNALTTLVVNNIAIQTNPKLVYNDPRLVVLAQDDARYEKISIEKRNKRNVICINNDLTVGSYPIREENIVLISNALYNHDNEPDKKYLHVNYCTLWADKDYEYDKGRKDRDRVAYMPMISKALD